MLLAAGRRTNLSLECWNYAHDCCCFTLDKFDLIYICNMYIQYVHDAQQIYWSSSKWSCWWWASSASTLEISQCSHLKPHEITYLTSSKVFVYECTSVWLFIYIMKAENRDNAMPCHAIVWYAIMRRRLKQTFHDFVRTYYTLALADNIVVNGFLILNFRQTGSGWEIDSEMRMAIHEYAW